MAVTSAGILLYRIAPDGEVSALVAHMGGPYWAAKDDGAWSIPKGEYDADAESSLDAARREFREETGLIVQVAAGPRAYSDVLVPRTGEKLHTVRLCWEVTAAPGVLCSEEGDSTDRVEWIPLAQALELPEMAPFVGAELRRCR